MTLFDALRANPGFLILTVTLIGLAVGSFLNVVIYRLPRMMEREFRIEARQILELPAVDEPPLSLGHPPSRCPSCGAGIRPHHNVPVLGWLFLRGRCANCQAAISPQYPLVEAACGLVSALCAWHFGWSAQLLPSLALTWTLIALAGIDLRTMLLPDSITLPLLWLGLLVNLFGVFTPLRDAVIGAMVGYGALWLVYRAYLLLTRREGMGYGDFKLLAAFGAWFGWQELPVIILLSSLVGASVGLSLIALKRAEFATQIPFGPYIAGAGWIAMLWGTAIKASYFAAAGIH